MKQRADSVNNLVDHLFRHESGRMVSVLSRLLGLQNLEAAQDITGYVAAGHEYLGI
jgi:hypothetical protein